MSVIAPSPLQAFHWSPQPGAERFVRDLVRSFLSRCPQAVALSRRMMEETGTRFVDWIEAIFLPDSPGREGQLAAVGYAPDRDRAGLRPRVFAHAHGMFPRLVLHDGETTAVHLKVESVADFAAAWHLAEPRQGEPLAPYRRLCVLRDPQVELWAAERWGWTGFELPPDDPARALEATRTLEAFCARRRDFADDAEGFAHALGLIESSRLATDFTCALWFEAERRYWQGRNRAARVQKRRQDALGLGWGNHDHHTYRSSRGNFARLVAVWERLGFRCRERFYAGREAGWGAQIMEQPHAGLVTFNDVDLSPDELAGDFGHEGLPPRNEPLGTIGLWCALHGESILQAGMHHLECQFDFDALRDQLAREGVTSMQPFTDLAYLRQAFTEGERWPVPDERLQRLLAAGQLTDGQAREFRERGALGSHLENLERNQGFKGFNQKGVSEIIAATDPRKHTLTPRDPLDMVQG